MTTPRVQTQELSPDTLDAHDRAALIDELYAVHTRIFSGVSREAFAAYVVEAPAVRNRIQVLRDAHGRAVGYFAFHAYAREINGRQAIVVRIESGYEPAYRGRSVGVGFFGRELLKTCLRYPLASKHYLGCYIHPTAYLAMSKIAPLWPRPQRDTPAAVEAVMAKLADSFAIEPVAEAQAGVHKVGWVTREGSHSCARWRRHRHPAVRFFVERNPGYAAGHGLLVYGALSITTLVQGAVKQLGRELRRQRAQVMPRVDAVRQDSALAEQLSSSSNLPRTRTRG